MAQDYGGKSVNIKHEDMRVVKTKGSLLQSFFKLLSEKTFEEITVNELCQEAGVRRATFYKHFEDKNDFLFKAVKMLRERFDSLIWKKSKPGSTKQYYVEYVRGLIVYINEHFTAARNILASNLTEGVIHIIAIQNYEETRSRLEKSVNDGISIPASVESTSLMLVGGVAQIIIDWVAKDRPVPVEKLFIEIEALVSALIRD